MSSLYGVVALSLTSAFAFAISTNLKHGSAADGPPAPAMRPAAILGFVSATLSHPLWLLSMAADGVGVALQILALHFGAIAVVQPLLATGLLFTLALRAGHRRRLRWREMMWATFLSCSLAGFLVVAGTSPGATAGEGVDRLPAVVAAAVGLAVAGSMVAAARRVVPPVNRAALLGVAVGIVYAADAALLKTCTDRFALGAARFLLSWQLYAALLVGALGLFLGQLAFEAGPLSASQPVVAAVDPLVSVMIGVLIFDERVRRGPLTGVLLVALVAALAGSIIGLARHAASVG